MDFLPRMERVVEMGLPAEDLKVIEGKTYNNASAFRAAVLEQTLLSKSQETKVLYYAEIFHTKITPNKLTKSDREWLGEERVKILDSLSGKSFAYKWQLSDALSRDSDQWKLLEQITVNKVYNKQINSRLDFVYRTFSVIERPR